MTEKNQLDGLRTDQVEAVFAAIPKPTMKEWFIWKEGFDGWKPFEDFPQLVLSLRKADDRIWESPPPPPGTEENTNPDLAPLSSQDQTRVVKPVAKTAVKTQQAVKLKAEPKPAVKKPESARAAAAGKSKMITPSEKLSLSGDDDDLELSLMRSGVLEDRNNMRFDKVIEIRIFVGDQSYKNSTLNISLKGMQLREPLPQSLPRYFNVEIGKADRAIPVVCSEVKSRDGGPSMRLQIESNEHASALLTMLLSGG